MLTGLTANETGVHANSGTSKVPEGSTIYEILHQVMPVPPTMGHIGSWVYTVNGILNGARDTAMPAEYIMSRGINDKYTGTATNDRLFGLLELDEFRDNQFFIFAHIKNADVVGHSTGVNDDSYPEAIVQADLRLGDLLAKLEELGLRDTTDIYITTDHGFWKRFHLGSTFHESVARTFIASSAHDLQCYANGSVLDVVPTLLDKLDISLPPGHPTLSGRSLLRPGGAPGYCFPGTCGDGVLAPEEDCEPTLPVTDQCQSLGLLRGTLGCNANCTFDTGQCVGEHPEVSLRISKRTDSPPRIGIRSRTRDTGGIVHAPGADSFMISITSPADQTWACEIPTSASDEWSVANSKFRFSGRELGCGIQTVRVNTNEDKPYNLNVRAEGTPGFPIIETGDTVTLHFEIGGLQFEANLLCTGKPSGTLICEDPTLD